MEIKKISQIAVCGGYVRRLSKDKVVIRFYVDAPLEVRYRQRQRHLDLHLNMYINLRRFRVDLTLSGNDNTL